MKLAMIGILALLLLGGGGAGAYFFFAAPAEASAGPMDEAAKAEHKAKEATAAAAATEAQREFVQMNAMIFPLIGDRGVTQTISLVVSLEVPDAATAEEVKKLTPRLTDAFIQDMYGTLNRESAMQNGVLQVAPLKARLNKITTKVLGEGKVNDVLLQVVQQRRI